jgi:polyisoprenoid-binding protein YceI
MSTRVKVVIGVVVVVGLAVGGGLYYFLRDDSPQKVSLENAAKSVRTTTTVAGATTTPGTPSAGIAGTWTVDNATGTFDFTSATGTFAGFRITEKLSSVGTKEAVGRTGKVTGTATIDGTTLTAATFTVDMSSITTDQSMRDSRVQSALQTDKFPDATFQLTGPVDLGADAANGKEVKVDAPGDLTIHGVTQPVKFPLQAKLVSGTVVVVGSLGVKLADYGVEKPSSPLVLSIEDRATIELQVLLTKS